MTQPQNWHLARIRKLAIRFTSGDLVGDEWDRVQRMLIKACQDLAADHGMDASTLYWAAIRYAPGDHNDPGEPTP
jgi:hypothetical protein